MSGGRKNVCVRGKPIKNFFWAEVKYCVNTYDSDLYQAGQREDDQIVDGTWNRIGWGGFAGDGERIYV